MKEKMEYLSCNSKTILGLAGLFTLIVLSILEAFTEFKITSEIRILLLSLIGYFNARGVLGSGFQKVDDVLDKTEKVIEDVEKIKEETKK